jgi:hypothetical protein
MDDKKTENNQMADGAFFPTAALLTGLAMLTVLGGFFCVMLWNQ